MKNRLAFLSLSLLALFLALVPTALASTTWYVDGVNGSDSNNCMSATTACKTIGHAISLAASGDSVMIAPATYTENLLINVNLKLIGSGATKTIIDGGGISTVISIVNTAANVTLSKVTISNGVSAFGGGIYNEGTLTVNSSTISGNTAADSFGYAYGGGIYSFGTLVINNSTLSGNFASASFKSAAGGAIYSTGALAINNSTLNGNGASGHLGGGGGGIAIATGTAKISNSTLSGNHAIGGGGGISNAGTVTISNSTLSGNTTRNSSGGGGISNVGTATLQNSIVANNTSGGNCSGTMTSNGYNLSNDGTCKFDSAGDLNNTDPQLGLLQNNGGPTQTMALPSSSPAVDAGNPNGCTDGLGHLLKTDQRGKPRPDTGDTGGCDMGAYEFQSPPSCIPQGGACYGPSGNHCCPAPRGHHSYCSNPTGWGTCTES